MSKTLKLSLIFLITVVLLPVCRIAFGYINMSDNGGSWLFSFVYQVLVLGLLPFGLYCLFFPKAKKIDYLKITRIETKINPRVYLIVFVAGILMYYMNTVISSLNYVFLNLFGYTYVNSVGTIYSSTGVLIMEIITTAMLPAIFEEIMDRGVFLSILEDVKSDKIKILIVGIMFGFLHQNIVQLTTAMFGGIVMAYVAVKTRSIIPSMILHFMNNLFVIITSYSLQKNGWFYSVYNSIFQFTFSNIITVFVMLFFASFMLITLLKQLKKISIPYREVLERLPLADRHLSEAHRRGFAEGLLRQKKRMEQENFSYIFSTDSPEIPDDENKKIDINNPHFVLAMKNILHDKNDKFPFKKYAFLYCVVIVSVLTTIFTYIWGLLR